MLYDTGLLKQTRLHCRVVSIGNLSMGGTGKTPATVYIASLLKEKGHTVGILSRGYGRNTRGTLTVSDGKKILQGWTEAGDEPVMIARQMPDIPVVVDEDRVRGGQFLISQFGVSTIILDDGFQHRKIARDLDIVLISDAPGGTGLQKLLPAGNYREPFSSLKRADVLVFSKVNIVEPHHSHISLATRSGLPVLQFQLIDTPTPGLPYDLPFLKKAEMSSKVVLVAGIGNPQAFSLMVKRSGLDIAGERFYRDHYSYTKEDLEEFKLMLNATGAEFILTTEKDLVRLESFESGLPVRVFPVRAISDNEDELLKLLLN